MARFLLVVAVGMVPRPGVAQYDVIIRGAHVLDGTGNPWRAADVGIAGDRIMAVGPLSDATAARIIDGTGKVVTPGFIDIHSHADDPPYGPRGLRSDDPRRRAAPNLVMQGITTVVVNGDGRSLWPIADQRAELESKGIGVNAVLMVGHGTVRREVMGDDHQRPATAAEVERMRALVRQGMRDGAWGMTAGLEYVPGRWSETEEVVALVEEIVPFDGTYIAHERSEGADPMWYWPSRHPGTPPTLVDAVQETITIGERTGARVVASHIKAKGAHYWGASSIVIRLIEEARDRGVQVYADQYPYTTTGSDGSTVLIPDWVWSLDGVAPPHRGSRDFVAPLRRALGDDSVATMVRMDVAHEIRRRGGAERIVVLDHPEIAWVGRSLADLASERGVTPVDMAIALQLEGDPETEGGGALRGFSLSDVDVEPYGAMPWTVTATDGWIVLPDEGLTHPRVYGTFPRKIAYYANERGVLSVEDAIRSSTSLPATVMGMADRGLVQVGAVADLVVLDLDELRDNATLFDPHQYPSGIDYVIIGGAFAVDGGAPTGDLIGQVLLKPR